jgi:hypothetical protein
VVSPGISQSLVQKTPGAKISAPRAYGLDLMCGTKFLSTAAATARDRRKKYHYFFHVYAFLSVKTVATLLKKNKNLNRNLT